MGLWFGPVVLRFVKILDCDDVCIDNSFVVVLVPRDYEWLSLVFFHLLNDSLFAYFSSFSLQNLCH